MSRASQQNALLIQHCYSPYGTIQLEKTVKTGKNGLWLKHLDKLEFGHSFFRQRTHTERKVIQTTFAFLIHFTLSPLETTEDWVPYYDCVYLADCSY